jgi:4-hydroxy-tetrahydrodipicolinate reductase
MEWHRRAKADRPSGTANAIAKRILPHLRTKNRAQLAEGDGAPAPDTLEIVSLRAGASPGMHVVGFDSSGESIELRISARDRSAYVAGALTAADWLLEDRPHPVGIYPFESVVGSMLAADQPDPQATAVAPARAES